jgi:2',3'-cyclic-nucleotide 2'-phosphodiesterase (5'-nucleotidase family)
MRRARYPWFLLAVAALLLVPPAWADKAYSVRLTLLHTNDTHGRLRPFSYPQSADADSPIAMLRHRSEIGGIARRAALAARIRAESGRHVLLLDSGDMCDGTPFSTEYRGDADIAAMNSAGYDMACPGNHEFNNTLAQVKKLAAQARFPILCANVREKATNRLLFTPYMIKQIAGARVAFFGLLTTETRSYPAARDECEIEAPIAVARRLVPQLRRNADFVVALTHLGVEEDRRLAVEVPGIDVIVGGHSHTLLPSPLFVGAVPAGNPQSVNGTIIVQNFQWGGTLGRLDLTLHRDDRGRWAVRTYSGRLLPVTRNLPEDPAVAAVVERYWRPLAPKYGEVLAHADADFTTQGDDEAHYNLMADAMRAVSGADFDLQNIGGVRAPLIKGPITYEDVVAMDPFDNTIITFSVTGRELRQLLTRLRPAVSGIRYVVAGTELVSAEIGGKPIEDERVYRGSTNSFFAGNPAFRDVRDRVDTGRVRREELAAYLRRAGRIKPLYDGRRVVREQQETAAAYKVPQRLGLAMGGPSLPWPHPAPAQAQGKMVGGGRAGFGTLVQGGRLTSQAQWSAVSAAGVERMRRWPSLVLSSGWPAASTPLSGICQPALRDNTGRAALA